MVATPPSLFQINDLQIPDLVEVLQKWPVRPLHVSQVDTPLPGSACENGVPGPDDSQSTTGVFELFD